jgi:MFS family permease
MRTSTTLRPEPPATRAAADDRLLTRPFLLLGGTALAYFTAIGVLLPTLPLFVRGSLGGGNAAVGLAQGVFYLSALVLRPWAGRVADRQGRRVLLAGGALAVTLSVATYGLAGSLPALVALRIVTGAGEACFLVAAFALVGDLAPARRRGEAMSLFSVAIYSGMAIGPALGEAVLRGGSGFGGVWLVAGLSALAAAVLASAGDEAQPPGARGDRAPSAPARLLHPAGVGPGLLLAAGIWGLAGFNAFIALHARDLGLGGAGALFLLFSALVVTVRILGARLPDRWGPRRTVTLGFTGIAAGLAVVATATGTPGLAAGTTVFALGQSLLFPALSSLAVARAPASERGAVVGTFTAFLDVAFGLGPVTLGAVAALTGIPGALLVAAGMAAAGATAAARGAGLRTTHPARRGGS